MAFSSEADTGSRQENAPICPRIEFDPNGKAPASPFGRFELSSLFFDTRMFRVFLHHGFPAGNGSLQIKRPDHLQGTLITEKAVRIELIRIKKLIDRCLMRKCWIVRKVAGGREVHLTNKRRFHIDQNAMRTVVVCDGSNQERSLCILYAGWIAALAGIHHQALGTTFSGRKIQPRAEILLNAPSRRHQGRKTYRRIFLTVDNEDDLKLSAHKFIQPEIFEMSAVRQFKEFAVPPVFGKTGINARRQKGKIERMRREDRLPGFPTQRPSLTFNRDITADTSGFIVMPVPI